MTHKFDKEYFTNNNYASYLDREERYARMMNEIHYDLFRRLCLDFTNERVVDFGCAVGFVTKALLTLGYKRVQGYDTSEWAIAWAKDVLQLKNHVTADITDILWNPKLMLAFDVFEHMNELELRQMLNDKMPNHLLVRIPLAKSDNKNYVLTVSERDPTHQIRWTRNTWKTFFASLTFPLEWQYDVNLGLFYDTPGVMCSMFRLKQMQTNSIK